jgi:hypothetical protein
MVVEHQLSPQLQLTSQNDFTKKIEAMTEARFQYDETLLERCAKSSVHKYIVVLTRTQQKPDGRGFEGEELGGDYDELTQSPELLRAKILEEENHLEDADDPYSCIQLFRQHQHHYRSPGTASFVDEISVSSYLYHPLEEQEPSNPSRRRFEAFVKNVGFVYRHNHNSSAYLHRVSLNRFSDMSASDIFASGTEEVRDSRRLESLGVEEGYDKDVFDSQLMDQLIREGVVIELHDVDSIVSVSLEGIGKGSMNHLNPKKYQKIYHQSNTLTLDTDAPVRRFQTPEVREEHDGAILSIRPEQQQQPYRSRDDDDDNDGGRPSSEHKTDEHPSSVNPVPVIEEPPEEDVDIFARSLNWATTENPDAVAIVHEPFDQVRTLWFWRPTFMISCAHRPLLLIIKLFLCGSCDCRVFVGYVWRLLGVRCDGFVGSIGLSSSRVRRLQGVHQASPVRRPRR